MTESLRIHVKVCTMITGDEAARHAARAHNEREKQEQPQEPGQTKKDRALTNGRALAVRMPDSYKIGRVGLPDKLSQYWEMCI